MLHGLGPAGADVGARVGLGEHHRRVPGVVDNVLGELLLVISAHVPQQFCEGERRAIHVDGGVGAAHHFGHSPAQRWGHDHAAKLDGGVEAAPFAVEVGAVGLLERLGDRDRLGHRVIDRRVAVAVDEARGELVLGQPGDLGKDVLGGLDIEVLIDPGAEHVLPPEDLEEVELQVADVGLVMTHRMCPSRVTGWICGALRVTCGSLHGPKGMQVCRVATHDATGQ